MMPNGSRSAGDHWDEYFKMFGDRRTGLHWWEIPGVLEETNRRISGDPEVDWVRYAIGKYFQRKRPVSHCLSLGCGTGALERQLAGLEFFVHCDAFDLSSEALEQARDRARKAGIDNLQYHQTDLNRLKLNSSYQAAWGYGAVHHLEELGRLFEELARALRPEGVLVLNEYIGPARFQFPERQKQIVDACLQLLPERYRIVIPDPRQGSVSEAESPRIRTRVGFPSKSDVVREDPSESVRSDQILGALRDHFDVLELTLWGGNIPQFLFSGIAGNFGDDPDSRRLVDMLWQIEASLLDAGELKSDFAFIVARPL